FLNVDAAADGEAYFHAGMSEAGGYHQRLSSGLMLTQLLLAQRKYGEYTDLMTDTVLPLLLKVWQPGPTVRLQDAGPRSELELFAGLTLLPLFAPEFVAQLPEQQV